MARAAPSDDRPEIAATIERALLEAVDARIRERPGLDRDAVIEAALRLWLAQAQAEAMEAQFATAPEDEVDPDEWASWLAIQRAATERWLKRGAAD
jgi:hypothetical protein